MSPESTATLPAGTIRYRDNGSGEPLLFVHGLLADATLWRKVMPLLEPELRCIAPDWPLGSHRAAMDPSADLSPPGLAQIIADFIDELELETVTLVGNDTGGAICQLVATRHPERIGRLVLTPCDAYDNFLPPMFRPLQAIARIPGSIWPVAQSLRLTPLRHAPNARSRAPGSSPRCTAARCAVTSPRSSRGSRTATRSRPPNGLRTSTARR